MTTSSPPTIPRLDSLRITNYRALRHIQINALTPLTVLVGPNGSGKSTVFDVFAFLAECFTVGVRRTVDKRNRFKELRSRGSTGPIIFELKYRETPDIPLLTYHLALDETTHGPIVVEEWLHWRRSERGRPFRFLNFRNGVEYIVSGEMPDEYDHRIEEQLESPDMLAVNTFGHFASHPRVSALRRVALLLDGIFRM